jgi:tellurite resistance protein TehA-like permease
MFRSYPALKRLGLMMFRGAAAALLLAAIGASAYGNASGIPPIVQGFAILDRSVAIVQCGLLAFLFVFAFYFRLSWRNFVFGIGLGLGIFSSVQLATSALRAGQGVGSGAFDVLVMGTYFICVLIWIAYVFAPEWRFSRSFSSWASPAAAVRRCGSFPTCRVKPDR